MLWTYLNDNIIKLFNNILISPNTNPSFVHFPIPGNDDASKSVECILRIFSKAVAEGLEERSNEIDQKSLEKKTKAKKISEESKK